MIPGIRRILFERNGLLYWTYVFQAMAVNCLWLVCFFIGKDGTPWRFPFILWRNANACYPVFYFLVIAIGGVTTLLFLRKSSKWVFWAIALCLLKSARCTAEAIVWFLWPEWPDLARFSPEYSLFMLLVSLIYLFFFLVLRSLERKNTEALPVELGCVGQWPIHTNEQTRGQDT